MCVTIRSSKVYKPVSQTRGRNEKKYVHRGLVVLRFRGDNGSPGGGARSYAFACLHGQLFPYEGIPGATHCHGCF